MTRSVDRGALVQELTRVNRWWTDPNWEGDDPQLRAVGQAPFIYRSGLLDDVIPPNLYTLRGPRRVGKSTLLKQTISRLCRGGLDPRRVCYFAADSIRTYRDIINMFAAAGDLFRGIDLGGPRYFLVDEISAVTEWQRGIKWVRDNTGVGLDCIIVSGSSSSDIAAGAEHLAGRRGPATELDRLLLPMAFPDFVRCAGYALPEPDRLGYSDFYTEAGRDACRAAMVHFDGLVGAFEMYLLAGGFPQAVSDFRRVGTVSPGFLRDLWDVVRSDLRRVGVSQPESCLVLLEHVATSLTSPVSMRTIADSLSVDPRTVGAWLEALASSYLLLILYKEKGGGPDTSSLRKVYPVDPLIAALPSAHSPGTRAPDFTRLAEAVLALAVFRAVERNAVDRFRQPGRVFYYRSRQNSEIDFLVVPDRKPAESKYIDSPDRRELRGMLEGFGEGILLTRSGVDLQPPGMIVPAAVFAWLLDQGK